MKNWCICMRMSLYLEFEAPTYVKVKAHTRRIGDKQVKVRPYFRRVRGRKGV